VVIRERESTGEIICGGLLMAPVPWCLFVGALMLRAQVYVFAMPCFTFAVACGVPGLLLWTHGARRPPEWLEAYPARERARQSGAEIVAGIVLLVPTLVFLVLGFVVLSSVPGERGSAVAFFLLAAACGCPAVVLVARGARRPSEWLEARAAAETTRRPNGRVLVPLAVVVLLVLMVMVIGVVTAQGPSGPAESNAQLEGQLAIKNGEFSCATSKGTTSTRSCVGSWQDPACPGVVSWDKLVVVVTGDSYQIADDQLIRQFGLTC
jgi:hypothetical protein